MFLHSLHYFPNVVLTALETKSFIFTPALQANILLLWFFLIFFIQLEKQVAHTWENYLRQKIHPTTKK